MSVENEHKVWSGRAFCWFTYRREGQLVFLEDRSPHHPGSSLLTFGIDNVVAYLVRFNFLNGQDNLVYLDTEGYWDRVLLSDRLEVAGFQHLRARRPEDAAAILGLDKVRR